MGFGGTYENRARSCSDAEDCCSHHNLPPAPQRSSSSAQEELTRTAAQVSSYLQIKERGEFCATPSSEKAAFTRWQNLSGAIQAINLQTARAIHRYPQYLHPA